MNDKIFKLETGFKNNVSLEKEEWVKYYEKEIDAVRNAHNNLIKKYNDTLYNHQKSLIENDKMKFTFDQMCMNLEQLQNDH